MSSEDRVEGDGGEGLYVRSEMALRRLESRVTGLIGLSGSLFAARRALCEPWPSDLASDFRLALECGRRGLRAVAAERAQVAIRTAAEPSHEWARKVRTVRRGLAVLAANRDLLAPRWGRLALALWGHKVARFTAPFALLVLLAASAAAATSPAGAALLALQLGAWSLAGLALLWPALAAWRLPRLAAFFALVNTATLVAWAHHLAGRRAVAWSPTRR